MHNVAKLRRSKDVRSVTKKFPKFDEVICRNSLVQFIGIAASSFIDVLRLLRDAIRRKRPENGESVVGFSFTIMLQHTGRFCSRTSRQRTMVTALELPPYSPDLASADFYLFC